MIRQILVTVIFFTAMAFSSASANPQSCGLGPQVVSIDTLSREDFRVHFDNGNTQRTHYADLLDSVEWIFRTYKHVAVIKNISVSSSSLGYYTSCTVIAQPFIFLKGGPDTTSVRGGGSEFCSWFLEEKNRYSLAYADSLPFKNLQSSPPCYTKRQGFFIEGKYIVNDGIAHGHKYSSNRYTQPLALDGMKRSARFKAAALPEDFRVFNALGKQRKTQINAAPYFLSR